VTVTTKLTDLDAEEDELYGFHIHEFGDLSDVGLHFNPWNKNHSCNITSLNRHVGDMVRDRLTIVTVIRET
jgi:Cu/Zn superoxide dismutase